MREASKAGPLGKLCSFGHRRERGYLPSLQKLPGTFSCTTLPSKLLQPQASQNTHLDVHAAHATYEPWGKPGKTPPCGLPLGKTTVSADKIQGEEDWNMEREH